MSSRQQRKENEGKEEETIPGSERQNLEIQVDTHSYLIVGRQPMSSSAKEVWEAAFHCNYANPHRITSLLIKEEKNDNLLQSSLLQPWPQFESYDEASGPREIKGLCQCHRAKTLWNMIYALLFSIELFMEFYMGWGLRSSKDFALTRA